MNHSLLGKLPKPLRIQILENSVRKDLTEEEKGEIQQLIYKEFKKFSKPGHRSDIKGTSEKNFTEVNDRILNAVGNIFNESGRTVQKRLFVFNEINKNPTKYANLKKNLESEKLSISFAEQTLRREKLKDKKPSPDPNGDRDLGYMDFPWDYGLKTSIAPKYRTMTIEEGKKMKTALKKDASLFFWVTMSNIEQAQELLNHWGFTIKSEIIWIKIKKGQFKASTIEDLEKLLHTNPGHYIEGAHEKLYICTRGNIGTPVWKPKSVVFAPKSAHSRKPAIFKLIIQKMYPHLSKREYFAREKGEFDDSYWSYWGDEFQN